MKNRNQLSVRCLKVRVGCFLRLICLSAVLQNSTAVFADELPSAPAGTQPERDSTASSDTATSTVSSEKNAKQPALPLSLQPYRVLVEVSGSDRRLTAELTGLLRKAISRMYGRMWEVDVAETGWLFPAALSRLDSLVADDFVGRYSDEKYQKIFMVVAESSEGVWSLGSREFDTGVRDLSPATRRRTMDHRAMAAAAAELLRDSFRPILLLSGRGREADALELNLQAGELPPPDPSAAQIADGDVLRPFLRYMQRRDPGKVREIQPLDLTYIRVTGFNMYLSVPADVSSDQDVTVDGKSFETNQFTDRSRVTGVVLAHGVPRFGGRTRSVQQVALRQRPVFKTSQVKLVLKSREDRPLVCMRIDRVRKLRYQDKETVPKIGMLSDREGRIELTAEEGDPTCWLYVYSGSLLLARVPYAPGVNAMDIIRLPDDSIRLGVEGELLLFRDRLVDSVAKMAVLKSQADKAIESGDQEKLHELLGALTALPGKKEFDADLNAIRVPAVERAREAKNRSAERAVDKLCRTMSESLATFFETEKHLQDLEEIQKLRALLEEQKAAQASR